MNDSDWKKYKDEIEPRIDKLYENNQHIEVIFFFSGQLEKEIIDTLFYYEKLSEKLLIKLGIKFSPIKVINKEKLTLGRLKNYLNVYCDDQELIAQIEKFNKIRIKTIHKIFDNDISLLEKEIINYLPEFYKLMENLLDLKIELLNKFAR